MKRSLLFSLGLVFAFVSGAIVMAALNQAEQQEPTAVVEMSDLMKKRAESGRAYLPFLNVSSMHCGVYHLPAGSKDGQSPHSEDEVYYVENGTAKIHIDGTDHDVKAGSVIFVKAGDKHYFHSIKEDLDLLVFFSKKKPE